MPQRGGAAKVTTDHDFIRRWVEDRGGYPAQVKRTSRPGSTGIIRVDYPGFSGAGSLEKITWKDFFDKFEENGLAFLYQEERAEGGESRFSKLVKREATSRRRTGARAQAKSGGQRARAGGQRARTREKATERTSDVRQQRTRRSTRSAEASARAGAGAKRPRKTGTTRTRAGSSRTTRKGTGGPRKSK